MTNRVSYGLPFVPCLLINLILFGILARAMFCYRGVVVCAWLFMSNHYHGIVLLKGDAEQMELLGYEPLLGLPYLAAAIRSGVAVVVVNVANGPKLIGRQFHKTDI